MNDRLTRLEKALEELRAENRELRAELQELRSQLPGAEAEEATEASLKAAAHEAQNRGRSIWRNRWSIIILGLCLVVVPILLWKSHLSTFWTTVVSAVNAIIVYFVGPGAIRLLIEGLVRAIPGVLLGQTARITVDSMRKKRIR